MLYSSVVESEKKQPIDDTTDHQQKVFEFRNASPTYAQLNAPA